MADRVAVFNRGGLEQFDTPQRLYRHPATRFVADFVGSSNVLPPDFVDGLGYGRHYASLRPEDITLGEAPGRKQFTGRVTAASFLGAANRVTVEANGARVAAMLPASIAVPAEGETVTLSFLPQDLHTMDGAQ